MAFVAAPPGSGKSFWIDSHPGWTDQDEWALGLGIHSLEWHASPHTQSEDDAHYAAIDVKTEAARQSGVCLLGALYIGIIPNAIVLIDRDVHHERCAHRDDLEWEEVEKITAWMVEHATKHGVPIYDNFDAAAAATSKHISDHTAR